MEHLLLGKVAADSSELNWIVAPKGIEPLPREPESLVLSIKLRGRKIPVAPPGIEPGSRV